MFDLPLLHDASLGNGEVDPEAAVAIGAMRSDLASIWALCELVSFGTVNVAETRTIASSKFKRRPLSIRSLSDLAWWQPYVESSRATSLAAFDASNPWVSSRGYGWLLDVEEDEDEDMNVPLL